MLEKLNEIYYGKKFDYFLLSFLLAVGVASLLLKTFNQLYDFDGCVMIFTFKKSFIYMKKKSQYYRKIYSDSCLI